MVCLVKLATADSAIEEQQLDTVNDKVRLCKSPVISSTERSGCAVTIVARYFPKEGDLRLC